VPAVCGFPATKSLSPASTGSVVTPTTGSPIH
jgi:hypothetical protein